ncbi:MAG: alpha/beta hydrolase [Gammaproteobacteria bacterium]|nr:alpha/beta hydrolase [Gammaproteobacteria bacterium]
MEQEIRFCTAGDGVRLACAASGAGTPLVKSAHWLTHLQHDWISPIWRHQHLGLSRHFRLYRYDQRGCGLSDHDVENMGFEAWVRDLETIVDGMGLDRFVLLGMSQGGPIAIEYAVRHPERVSHLVLYGSYVRGRRHWDGDGDPAREADALIELIRLGWHHENPAFRQVFSSLFIPGADMEQVRQFNDLQRRSTSPETAARIVSETDRLDVTESARRVRVPTLVLHCEGDARIPFSEGRRLAGEIPGARFMPLAGENHIMLEGEPAWDALLAEILRFSGAAAPAAPKTGADALPSGRLAALTAREREVALVGPARAGVYIHLMPVFGALLGYLLLGEALQPYHALGAALVAIGIVLTQRRAAGVITEGREGTSDALVR